jgi:mRNA-degrading endonuclease RelE of RelBE toxin-antitoxin system
LDVAGKFRRIYQGYKAIASGLPKRIVSVPGPGAGRYRPAIIPMFRRRDAIILDCASGIALHRFFLELMAINSYVCRMARVGIKRKAYKQLAKLPEHDQAAVLEAVTGLAQWPGCREVKALTGRQGYRLRVGRYRVLFTVDTDQNPVVISVEEVKKRDERTYQ